MHDNNRLKHLIFETEGVFVANTEELAIPTSWTAAHLLLADIYDRVFIVDVFPRPLIPKKCMHVTAHIRPFPSS
jgi:hypothetical protein